MKEPTPSVVALYGPERQEELEEGGRESVIPFVGTDGVGPTAVLGVGIMHQSSGRVVISGGSPRQLIRSWRAYQLLAHVPTLAQQRTLSACWEVVVPDLSLDGNPHFGHLAELFKGTMLLYAARVRVPLVFELEDMVEALRGGGVFVDPAEFENEIRAGRLKETARLRRLIERLQQDIS